MASIIRVTETRDISCEPGSLLKRSGLRRSLEPVVFSWSSARRAFSYRKIGRKKPSFSLIEQSKFVVLLIRGLKFLREGLSLITRPGLCPGFFCFRPTLLAVG
jgi:hypothetical protein